MIRVLTDFSFGGLAANVGASVQTQRHPHILDVLIVVNLYGAVVRRRARVVNKPAVSVVNFNARAVIRMRRVKRHRVRVLVIRHGPILHLSDVEI